MKVDFMCSNIVTAFDKITVGSKVINVASFWHLLEEAVKKHDVSNDRILGQHYVKLDGAALLTVSSGVGKRPSPSLPEHYVMREHRGHFSAYLRRRFAAPVDSLACVVYTKEAYLNDPDVVNDDDEKHRIHMFSESTHVLVAVLASSGPASPLPPYRLVHNLAGGNLEALVWTADEIRTKAKQSIEYWNEWSMVSD